MVNYSKRSHKRAKSKGKTKKLVVKKATSRSASHSMDSKAVQESSSSGACVDEAAVCKEPSIGWFTSEIQLMMHGFGDCNRPLLESAQLIEEIVHQQLNSMLIQTADFSVTRGARCIGIEDILFLLRKDKVKLARLIRYLEIKDLKATVVKNVEADGNQTLTHSTTSRSKYKKTCLDFLAFIDQTGELISAVENPEFDDIKFERDLRAERMTRFMDQEQYMEFCDARRTSFTKNGYVEKFLEWLLKDNVTNIMPNALALEMFHYMAHETVAQIVDLALLVKKDAERQSGDRRQHDIPEYPKQRSTNPLFNPAGCSSSSESTPSPPDSPPVDSELCSTAEELAAASTSTVSAQGEPNPKKRKVEGGSPILTSECIQPSDIREAIQRYWKQGGPYTLFSKSYWSNLRTKLLCA